MAGLELIEPTQLYNLLNQSTGAFPCLSDPNYLLLIDSRKKNEYSESHVITSKNAPKNPEGEFILPYDAELECKTHVVIYDGSTDSLKNEGPAIECAKLMWNVGSRNPVKILKGGYEDFSALYPFLRTQKIMYMPLELDDIKTYPVEVLPGLLYMGTTTHGNSARIQKELKIKGHINCSQDTDTFFKEEGSLLMHIPVTDSEEFDLLSKFESACTFIDNHKERNSVVLVFSTLGISRSASVVIAYLMHHFNWTVKEAFNHVIKCCVNTCPNRGFLEQLLQWEENLRGEKITDIAGLEK